MEYLGCRLVIVQVSLYSLPLSNSNCVLCGGQKERTPVYLPVYSRHTSFPLLPSVRCRLIF